MAQVFGPTIVRNGLVLALDAADKKSYPGSGTTWYDISGNNNNCVWGSTPTFNTKYFTFNGSSNYGTVTNNSSLNFSENQTVMIVMRHTYTSGRKNPWDQAYGGYGTWTHEQGVNINYYYGDAGSNTTPYTSLNSGTTSTGVWNMMCITRNPSTVTWYKNQTLADTAANPYDALLYTSANITIGSGYAGYWEGDMALVLAYTRCLTSSEIIKNYNALKTRFGL
jgi:hypothetical protein